MGKTYRDIARAKINQYYKTRRELGRGYIYWQWFKMDKEDAELRLNLDKSLPNGYTYSEWNFGKKSDWKIEGNLHKQRSLLKEYDKEINPYRYPIPYFTGMYFGDDQIIEDWDLNDDWDYNAYDYPHVKRKKYTKSTRPKAKPWRSRVYGKYWWFGNKPESACDYKVYETKDSKDCVHDYLTTVDGKMSSCVKCGLLRIKKNA